jgi:hypothetical protein
LRHLPARSGYHPKGGRGFAEAISRLAERYMLHESDGEQIDGLWIGSWLGKDKDAEFRRVAEALGLIKTYDRLHYNRLIRDLKRIWVVPLPGYAGTFSRAIGCCKLDPRIVLAEPPEVIASVIVHEATHARLFQCGIGYEEANRARVEAVCTRRELAFAGKLPNGELVREYAVHALELYVHPEQHPEHWTNASLYERRLAAGVEVVRYAGLPEWPVRALVALHAARQRISRSIRGLVVRLRS